jgi:hypothetical protein
MTLWMKACYLARRAAQLRGLTRRGGSFLPAKRRKIRRMDTAAPSEREAKNGNEDQSKRRPVRIRRSADVGKGCSCLTVAVQGTFVVLALTFASRLDIQARSE